MTFNSHCSCILLLYCELHHVPLWTVTNPSPLTSLHTCLLYLKKITILELVLLVYLVLSLEPFEHMLFSSWLLQIHSFFWEHVLVLFCPTSVGFLRFYHFFLFPLRVHKLFIKNKFILDISPLAATCFYQFPLLKNFYGLSCWQIFPI